MRCVYTIESYAYSTEYKQKGEANFFSGKNRNLMNYCRFEKSAHKTGQSIAYRCSVSRQRLGCLSQVSTRKRRLEEQRQRGRNLKTRTRGKEKNFFYSNRECKLLILLKTVCMNSKCSDRRIINTGQPKLQNFLTDTKETNELPLPPLQRWWLRESHVVNSPSVSLV